MHEEINNRFNSKTASQNSVHNCLCYRLLSKEIHALKYAKLRFHLLLLIDVNLDLSY
jgi:hypothetical protein